MTPSTQQSILVTGCAGFIGGHLGSGASQAGIPLDGLDLTPAPRFPGRVVTADIRDRAALSRLTRERDAGIIVHLAALGEVLVPWEQVASLYETNTIGTQNVLEEFDPRMFVLASTSAVYGNSRAGAALPRWDEVHPVGHYGLSKASAEMLCSDWAQIRQRPAIVLRFGNVVGPNCRGLIRYLVEHAMCHPHADKPAQLRGAGKLVRDYVPVQLVVEALLRTVRTEWAPGVHTLNISSGRGMTNREVVDITVDELNRLGFPLSLSWDSLPGPGEASSVVLDPGEMVRRLGLPVPDPAQVQASIRSAVRASIRLARKEVACGSC